MTAINVPTRKRFTVKEYYQLAEAGIIGPNDRTELIDGEVILMPPSGDLHAGNVAIVRCQGHIRLNDHDQPEPDLVLLRPRADFSATSSPTAADVFLIMEAADATLRYDRRVKGPLYAHAGIPEYGLLDVNRATLTVYRNPTPEGYRTAQTFRRGDRLAPLAFPDRTVAVTDLIGEAR